jgi:hypothetical protein
MGTNTRKYQMEYITTEMLIYLWLFGFAIHMSYMFGNRKGIEDAIDYLAEKGIIELDDE